MRSCRACLMPLVLASLLAGCSSNAEKGVNKHKDMPVSPAAEQQQRTEKK